MDQTAKYNKKYHKIIIENLKKDINEEANKLKAISLRDQSQDVNLRKLFSYWAIILLSLWLVFVTIILWEEQRRNGLSDTVLITLLSTTTINLISIPYIIVKNLFSKNKS